MDEEPKLHEAPQELKSLMSQSKCTSAPPASPYTDHNSLPDRPCHSACAHPDDQPNIDEEPKLHEIAAALKAGASSTQQARQELGRQQEQEQQGRQEPQVGDVVSEDEPDLPIASRRLLSDPDEVTDDATGDAASDAAGAGDDAETQSPAEEGTADAAGAGDAQATDESGEAVVVMEDDAAPAEAWTRKLMQSGNPGGSNQPGLFTTGDNPLQHTAGIASDNPSGTPRECTHSRQQQWQQ